MVKVREEAEQYEIEAVRDGQTKLIGTTRSFEMIAAISKPGLGRIARRTTNRITGLASNGKSSRNSSSGGHRGMSAEPILRIMEGGSMTMNMEAKMFAGTERQMKRRRFTMSEGSHMRRDDRGRLLPNHTTTKRFVKCKRGLFW